MIFQSVKMLFNNVKSLTLQFTSETNVILQTEVFITLKILWNKAHLIFLNNILKFLI